jgi:hypothetical protein
VHFTQDTAPGLRSQELCLKNSRFCVPYRGITASRGESSRGEHDKNSYRGAIALIAGKGISRSRMALRRTSKPYLTCDKGIRKPYELSMAKSSALARDLAFESAALCFSLSDRSSAPPDATETMQRIVSAPRTRVIEN